jgi:hypothetical protein
MNSTNSANCTRCGTPIPEGAADRLCPACLMSGAIAGHGVITETELAEPGASAHAPKETPPDPTEFPCELGGYRLLSLLGSGGMGSVYEAEQLATGRRVALKMLGQKLDSPDMRKRFLREGRLAASVSHPNTLYVFGTEEIEGRLVILMEIASGGTLNDKLKKRGPLPVTEAVDTILDVIAGLEAALAGGVLHRDVKPSNCFVSPDGSVKVGDFGLSVSTVATADTFQTATGVIMGTPAYAPPEQLRGRDLDVRADIYSVGATLFTLLTNEPPIEGSNPVEVVAAALDEKPKSLTEHRKDISPGLAKVVARCLAKKPEQRYSDYSALRNALLPFSSAQPVPAPLGRRFLAGFIDFVIVIFIPYLLFASQLPVNGLLILGLVYYTMCEGIWGAGIGKALLGFRVVRTDGQRPGLARAFFRPAILPLLGIVGVAALGFLLGIVGVAAAHFSDLGSGPGNAAGLLFFLFFLAFVTMRRRNGFATVWDLATGTRVVVKPRCAERPVIEVEEEPEVSVEEAVMVGPYPVVEEIVPGEWIAADDPILRRRVWLRRRAGSEIAPARRDLARPGRNQWLHNVETPEANWDVFESQAGVPLRSLIAKEGHLPWESMRHWLHDLASEIALAAHDETLPPELSLDHVWITARGPAVLLDEPWPKTDDPAERIPVGDLAGQQRFLHTIAASVSPTTVPLHARPVLQSLAGGSFEKLSFLAGNLRSLVTKPATLDRQFRAASLLAMPLTITLIFAAILIPTLQGTDEWTPDVDIWEAARQGDLFYINRHAAKGTDLNAREPESGSTPLTIAASRGLHVDVWMLLDRGADVNSQNSTGGTALHLATFFGNTKTVRILLARGADPEVTNNRGQTPLDVASTPWSAELEETYRATAQALEVELDLERIKAARPKITELLRDPTSVSPVDAPRGYVEITLAILVVMGVFVYLAALLAVTQLISLLAARGTLGQFVFGFAVVDAAGAPASRARLFARWLVAWIPVLLIIVFLRGGAVFGDVVIAPDFIAVIERITLFHALMLITWFVGLAAAIVRPARGLHDQLTGCWLVRR